MVLDVLRHVLPFSSMLLSMSHSKSTTHLRTGRLLLFICACACVHSHTHIILPLPWCVSISLRISSIQRTPPYRVYFSFSSFQQWMLIIQ